MCHTIFATAKLRRFVDIQVSFQRNTSFLKTSSNLGVQNWKIIQNNWAISFKFFLARSFKLNENLKIYSIFIAQFCSEPRKRTNKDVYPTFREKQQQNNLVKLIDFTFFTEMFRFCWGLFVCLAHLPNRLPTHVPTLFHLINTTLTETLKGCSSPFPWLSLLI